MSLSPSLTFLCVAGSCTVVDKNAHTIGAIQTKTLETSILINKISNTEKIEWPYICEAGKNGVLHAQCFIQYCSLPNINTEGRNNGRNSCTISLNRPFKNKNVNKLDCSSNDVFPFRY